MNKEIIFRDATKIEHSKALNGKYINLINKAIADIRATGVELTDDMLPMFINNPERVIQEVDRQVRAEQDKMSKFKFFSKTVDTFPLTDEIRGILSKLNRELFRSNEEFSSTHIVFINGKAEPSPVYEEQIEAHNSVVIDTDVKEKAWQMACEIKDKLDKLEDFLVQSGGGSVHSICKDKGKLYSDCLILVNDDFQSTYRVRLNPEIVKLIK